MLGWCVKLLGKGENFWGSCVKLRPRWMSFKLTVMEGESVQKGRLLDMMIVMIVMMVVMTMMVIAITIISLFLSLFDIGVFFGFLWSIMWPLDGICRKKIDTRCICLRSKSFDIPYRGDKMSWRRGSLCSTPLHWSTLRPETDNFWNMTVKKFCFCEVSFFHQGVKCKRHMFTKDSKIFCPNMRPSLFQFIWMVKLNWIWICHATL